MMRFLRSIVVCALMALLFVGCSSSDASAGIEIGNPEIQSVALTADFSIDYSDAKPMMLAKPASTDEDVVIDTFHLTLMNIISYSSFYTGVSTDEYDGGVRLWPYRDNPAAVLPISFTEGEFVKDAFDNINLKRDGFLKEIGVGFEVNQSHGVNAICGRVRKDGKKIPFVYELSNFQSFSLRYHFSQIDLQDSVVNLSVMFRVHRFADVLDFASAEIGEDGVIHISKTENESLWKLLNERFVPSFQALRYEYSNARGRTVSDYVDDIWDGMSEVFNKNLITNGDFKDGSKDWIFHTQFRGVADTAIVQEKNSNVMSVRVTNGGDTSFSVQLLHENIPVVAGATYKFVFTIWSDVEDSVTARLGTYLRYTTNGFQEHVFVSKAGKSFEIEFSPSVTDPFARLDLNLGRRKRTFWIKDVQLIRIR